MKFWSKLKISFENLSVVQNNCYFLPSYSNSGRKKLAIKFDTSEHQACKVKELVFKYEIDQIKPKMRGKRLATETKKSCESVLS